MVESRRPSTIHFSWADEVEKEEKQEEARSQPLLRRPKPNPFGSARPREVVLEEKGIDWRKLDQELHQSSTPSSVYWKEKKLKENIPTTAESIHSKEPVPLWHHGPEQNKQDTSSQTRNARHVHRQIAPLSVCPDNQKQNLGPFVPPLIYPPRNVREEMQGSYPFYKLDVDGWQNSPYKRHLRELDVEWERENVNSHTEEFIREANNARIRAHYKTNARENCEIQFSRRNCVGERFMASLEESYFGGNYENRGVRLDIERSDWENTQYEYGRSNYDVREFVSHSKRAIVGGRARGHCDLNMESPGSGRNYRKRGMSSAPEISHYHKKRTR